MAAPSIPLEVFDSSIKLNFTGEPPPLVLVHDHQLTCFTEVSTSAIGGRVIACSDDFFVSRDNLIKPGVSASFRRRVTRHA